MALATLADMFPSSPLSRKIDGDDQREFDTLVAVWMKGLEGLTRTQVEQGIQVAVKSGSTFVPSLPEFRLMCKGSGDPSHKLFPTLPKPKADPEIARQAIAEMRRVLGKRRAG